MRLVKFKCNGGGDVWVNPDFVDSVFAQKAYPTNTTKICFTGDSENSINVVELPDVVVDRLVNQRPEEHV